LVTAEDVTNGKPHPEPYLRGAQLLGAKPEDCLVIEDAPAGIQSALAGGMKVVGLTSTYGAPQLRAADAVVKKLAQVQVRKDGPGRLAVSLQGQQ
jgi:sugar-phosphatase